MTSKKKQGGSAMLLALFVMGAMLIVALGTSSLALNQIRQTRDIKKSMVAFYMAEGGIEDGLFQVRKNYETVQELEGYGSPLSPNYPMNATSTMTFVDTEAIIYDHLKVNEIVSLDLYNIDNFAQPADGIKSISLEWDGKPMSWLELSWRSLGAEDPYYTTFQQMQKRMVPFPGVGTSKVVNLNYSQGDYTWHSLQIKALYDEVKNLRIKAYSDTEGTPEAQVNVPSRLYITATGKYPESASQINSALQSLTVSLPEKTPVAPLADYVVFSEGDIIKQILYTGSQRGQLIYLECGPYVWYPDCKHTFTGSNWPNTDTITVQNIGIEEVTITSATTSPLNYTPPPNYYSITTNNCLGVTLQYNETCTIEIEARKMQGAEADLSVVTSTPIFMLLEQRWQR